ncbi:MAG: thioredoxin-disulfide reductase [Candidatus Marinimicrobia bacterium]|nr:thioredoxin-disulfide reductase [Candidatus Neomarinimicrobiota bacterium]
MEKAIVIGTGPAGLTAAIYLARARLAPLVIEGLLPGGQLTTTTEVENFPGFEKGITGPDLMEVMKAQAARFGARFTRGEVTAVDFEKAPLRLTLDESQPLETATVLIATGASARYLGLPSEQQLIGRGVSSCATCDGAFFRDVPVAVVGGGDSALEEALFLTRFASRVYVIHRRDQLRASKIMSERALAHERIEMVWDSLVVEVKDVEQGQVTGLVLENVKTRQRRELPVTGLFLGIGHVPNTKPFRGQLEMDERGYLITRQTRTRVPGVFAAGDVQDAVYRQAVTAAGSGCMAALEAERYLESLGQ